MKKQQIEEQGYLVTHHLREVDQYILPYGRGTIKIRVYALLRDNRRYATVTALAGKTEWTPEIQACIRNLMLKACPPVVQIGRYQREPHVDVDPRMARAYHVIPSLAEQLCKQLVEFLRTLPE